MKNHRLLKCLVLSGMALGTLGVAMFAHQQLQAAHASKDDYWENFILGNESTIERGGTNLVNALRPYITQIADGQSNTISYNGLWTAYAESDGIPGSNGTRIYDMYGGFEYKHGTDQGGNYSKEGDCYNREHSVPKSWFSEKTPAYSDIIHVVPSDGKVNGMRSNYAFGEVDAVTYSHSFPARSYNGVQYQKAGISKLGSPKSINGVNITNCSDNKVFEPDDQYKGDFARIYMYFAVRYAGGTCSPTSGDGRAIFTSTCTDSNPYMTNYGLALIQKWHVQDPVSEKEELRNDAVEKLQGNRNPFVDYPEWADKIFGTNYEETYGQPSTDPAVKSVSVSPSTLTLDISGETKTATLTATVVAVNDAPETVTWSSSNTSVATVNDGVVTAVGTGSATIKATSTFNTNKFGTCVVTVRDSSQPVPAVNSVTVSPTTLNLDLNGTRSGTLQVSVDAVNGATDTVTWSSSNTRVATVNNGVVTAVGKGSATIKATSTYDTTKFGSCSVTVVDTTPSEEQGQGGEEENPPVTPTGPRLVSIEVTPPTKTTYKVGEQLDLTGFKVIAHYSDNSTKDVTSSITLSIDTSAEGSTSIFVSYTENGVTVSAGSAISFMISNSTGESDFGCGGSIIATSALISITSLLGAGLILIKKRRKFEDK